MSFTSEFYVKVVGNKSSPDSLCIPLSPWTLYPQGASLCFKTKLK